MDITNFIHGIAKIACIESNMQSNDDGRIYYVTKIKLVGQDESNHDIHFFSTQPLIEFTDDNQFSIAGDQENANT